MNSVLIEIDIQIKYAIEIYVEKETMLENRTFVAINCVLSQCEGTSQRSNYYDVTKVQDSITEEGRPLVNAKFCIMGTGIPMALPI